MAEWAELGGVRTWYETYGEGDPLVLMHGGAVDSRFFAPNLDTLAARFHVYTPDRRGHGHSPDVEGPITYDLMAQDMVAFMDTVVGGPAHIVGHSDGAIVALVVARLRPDLVRDLVLISGGFHKDGFVPGGADIDVDEVVQFLGASYGEVSPDGEEHYPVVIRKIVTMAEREPIMTADEAGEVSARTLVVASDDDIFTLEHTIELYRAITHSELAVVPGTSHFLTQEKPELVNKIVVDFLTAEPVELVAPMRRAPKPSN